MRNGISTRTGGHQARESTIQKPAKLDRRTILARLRVLLILNCAALLPLLPADTGNAQDQTSGAREMIQSLDAYAVYKMGMYDEAFERYLQLAKKGNRQGILNVARMYTEGRGVRANPQRALMWYRRAADAGDSIGQYELARAYDEGIGIAPDPGQARHWYRLAAQSGSSDAQWLLGQRLYQEGEHAEALVWIRQAANEGAHPDARQFLAERDAGVQSLETVPQAEELPTSSADRTPALPRAPG